MEWISPSVSVGTTEPASDVSSGATLADDVGVASPVAKHGPQSRMPGTRDGLRLINHPREGPRPIPNLSALHQLHVTAAVMVGEIYPIW
jgi:hypothetical protein